MVEHATDNGTTKVRFLTEAPSGCGLIGKSPALDAGYRGGSSPLILTMHVEPNAAWSGRGLLSHRYGVRFPLRALRFPAGTEVLREPNMGSKS